MSLIRLANGHKYEIEQPNEGEGMMRNRRRNTVQITFRAGAEQFDAIPTTKPRMNRMSSLKASATSCLKPSRWWAIGRIKKSSCRKKPARPRPYTDASCPLRSENDWQAIHDYSAPLGRFLIF